MTVSRAERRTRLDADDRREQIMRAARDLFARLPYESVSTGDIASAAGTTRTNVYHYFTSKRELFLEIIQRFSRIPAEPPEVVTAGSVGDRVSAVLGRWLDVVDENRGTFMTMLNASSSKDDQVSQVLLASMQAWQHLLALIVGLDPTSVTHRAMIRSFQAMVSQATAAWLERGEIDKAQVHTMLSDCLVALGDAAMRPQ